MTDATHLLPEELPLPTLQRLMEDIHLLDATAVLPVMAKMAAILLQYLVLRVGDRRYRIADIEFYLHSRRHEDTYIHGDVEQLQCGRWYYNRAGGVDLTFGNGTDAGGILVRGLMRLDAVGGIIYGPQRVLRELLAAQAPVWKPTGGWWLAVEEPQLGPIWKTARVNLKKMESPYRALPYRFLAHAEYLLQLPRGVRSQVWRELGVTKDELVGTNPA
jgi:hypothetical protein